MALAERLHHSANVTDLRKKEEVEQVWYNALRGQKTARAGGGLPAPLSEVAGRQEVLVRHVVEHMADVCPVVQTLDAPVPQMVDTVLEFFRALDLPVVEQVIAVPKISTDRLSQRLVERRLAQMVEQLVEVRCSGLWSSTSTFQFLVVEAPFLVFMVFSQDSVQQRRLPGNAFLSGLWSR